MASRSSQLGWPPSGSINHARPIDFQDPQSFGVKAAWPMQMSAGIKRLRDVVGKYSGDLAGDATWINDPEMGPAINLSGTGYIDTSYLPFSHTMTAEAWFRTSASGDNTIMSWGNSAGGNPAATLKLNNSDLYFYIRDDSGTADYDTISGNNDGAWHHVRVVLVSNSLRHIFLDGVLVSTTTTTLGAISFNLFKIGVFARNVYQEYFNGDIAFPRVRYTADTATAWQAWAPKTRWDMLNVKSQADEYYAPAGPTPSTGGFRLINGRQQRPGRIAG